MRVRRIRSANGNAHSLDLDSGGHGTPRPTKTRGARTAGYGGGD